MQRIRTTTNKWGLFARLILGLFFAAVGVTALYKGIYYGTVVWPIVYDGFQSGELEGPLPILIIGFVLLMFVLFVFVFFRSGLLALVMSVKGFFDLLKKQRIKRNKERMKKIDAKIVSFELCGEVKKNGTHVSSIYYFTASDGVNDYDSEEFNAKVTGRCGNIGEALELMQISYNPENPEVTIRALNERLKIIEIELQEQTGIKATLLRGTYAATQKVKEELRNGIAPYMEFRGHKLSLGDKVSVFIDPNNHKNYRIDTDFLYT